MKVLLGVILDILELNYHFILILMNRINFNVLNIYFQMPFFFISSCFYVNFWWTVHKANYPSLMENSLKSYCFSEMM